MQFLTHLLLNHDRMSIVNIDALLCGLGGKAVFQLEVGAGASCAVTCAAVIENGRQMVFHLSSL